jgi:hypothetical protein
MIFGYFDYFLFQLLKLNLIMICVENLDELLLLDASNRIEVITWCELFDCTEDTLFICMYYSGNSIVCIQSFLSKNKEWLEKLDYKLK